MATSKPSHGLSVLTVTLKAAIAPINIMPSTPRFMTPDRSAKISPSVANNNTVPVATPACRMMIRSMVSGLRSTGDVYPIAYEEIAGDQANQHNALNHLGDARGVNLAASQQQSAE